MIGALPAINRLARTEDAPFTTTGPAAVNALPEGGASFGSALATAAGRTIGTLEQAEQLSALALQGRGDTREVVDAVMSAEQSLQAAIAIRDKIVTSYLEISRMQI